MKEKRESGRNRTWRRNEGATNSNHAVEEKLGTKPNAENAQHLCSNTEKLF